MTRKRRLTLVLTSVGLGTILSAILLASRGKLEGTGYVTLFFNMAIAIAVIFGLGAVFKSMDRKHKEENGVEKNDKPDPDL
jgi:hypothetical protein